MKLRLSSAILAGRAVSKLSRAFGYDGSSLPGMLARVVYPQALKELAAQVRKGIIVVSGTNGKTTTANMIAGVLREAGYKVISNREGANMISGVTTSFIMDSLTSGKIDCDYAVIEIDEASIPDVLKNLTPKVVVLTNFFRDQLDRYWELEKIIGIIWDKLRRFKQTALVLNADDPLVAQFKDTTGLKSYFYGMAVNEKSKKTSSQTRESKFCPFCGSVLAYEYFHYGQLGSYSCQGCHFKRPRPQVEAVQAGAAGDLSNFKLIYNEGEVPLAIKTQGLYNLYNAMAAFSVGMQLGIDVQAILSGLKKYQPALGRMEKFKYRNKRAYLNLVKNPTGFNQGLAALYAAQGTKDVFIALNDNYADSRDISWIWDVDFEMLGADHKHLRRFVCSGLRGEDMALRLKYAGVPAEKITVNTDMRRAIKTALNGQAGSTYLFSTYTALRPVHKIVKTMAEKGDKSDQRVSSVS